MKLDQEQLERLAKGRALFTGDLPLPVGSLHACPAVSPHAHARFTHIDTTAALAEPGVMAVLTSADVPGCNEIGNLYRDEPLLAEQEVRCVGQVYALVVATTAESAWRGAQQVKADWELLPACFDARAAFAAGELIQPPRTFALGDTEAHWADCATLVSGQVSIGGAEHLYMETQCALALPVENGIKVHSATQSPSGVQKAIAAVTALPMHRVEVDVVRLGGAFGGKEEQATGWAALAALAALQLQHPVRIWPQRSDDMRLTGKRHPYQADYRLGLDADGRLLCYETFLYQNAGCSADLSTAVLERSLFHATNAYYIPHVRVTAASCRTNLPSNTAFRGFGAPQAILVVEAALRDAARQLGVAPETLQAKNLLRHGDSFPYGMPALAPRAQDSWQQLNAWQDMAARRLEIARLNAESERYRRGMAVVPVCFGIAFTATLLNQGEALIHIYGDGSVSVSTGAVEMGQGVNGKIRRIVARTLGVALERINIASTNTLRVANLSPTAASTGADINGAAARQACLSLLAGLRPVAAEQLGCREDALVFAEDRVRCDDRTLAWPELVAEAYRRRVSLSALAHYATPGLHFDAVSNTGRPFAYHVYGTALVEAEVDIVLGTGAVTRVEVVHDAGNSLDSATDIGQIEGALVQGIGWMTTEEIIHDARGRLLTDSLASYKIPDLRSAPPMEISLLPEAEGTAGILNSKAVGEPPLIYGLGAALALQEAVNAWRSEQGMQPACLSTPLTSERLFMLLHGESEAGWTEDEG